jgi:hypothetical protein
MKSDDPDNAYRKFRGHFVWEKRQKNMLRGHEEQQTHLHFE